MAMCLVMWMELLCATIQQQKQPSHFDLKLRHNHCRRQKFSTPWGPIKPPPSPDSVDCISGSNKINIRAFSGEIRDESRNERRCENRIGLAPETPERSVSQSDYFVCHKSVLG